MQYFQKKKEAWEIKADYRFTHKMVKDNEIFDITDIGDIPEGYTLVTNEEAEELQKKIDIQKLSMTKLDFFKYVVQPNGISYTQLKEIIASDENLSAQWDLCSAVYRYNSLLDESVIQQFIPTMTSDELDSLFEKYGKNTESNAIIETETVTE